MFLAHFKPKHMQRRNLAAGGAFTDNDALVKPANVAALLRRPRYFESLQDRCLIKDMAEVEVCYYMPMLCNKGRRFESKARHSYAFATMPIALQYTKAHAAGLYTQTIYPVICLCANDLAVACRQWRSLTQRAP